MWRRALTAVVVLFAGLMLGGCGSLNTVLSSTIADFLPHWAGGLPPGAPPRPGDRGYDEFIRSQHAKALVIPAETAAAPPPQDAAVVSQSSARETPIPLPPRSNPVLSWHSIY